MDGDEEGAPKGARAEIDPLYVIVAAMLVEYEMDDSCDYVKINQMIEEAAKVVGGRLGGNDRLRKLADLYTPDAMWDLMP